MKNRPQSLFEDLNSAQREAVEASEGPVLILAGAGSGKTRVLTYRIAYLIQEKKISPVEILAMTFTNKAAGEMKERVKKFVDDKHLSWIGTFHSIFSRILRYEAEAVGYTSDFVIYDKEDQERLVKSVMQELSVSPMEYAPRSVLSAISRSKNNLIYPEAYAASAEGPFQKIVSKVYPVYQSRLRENHAFDFDDLITVPITVFMNHPKILERYQSRFRYILVDEYQDTNRAQYELIHCLAREHRNLCVVGDDDQSIYGWRGADIRNILEFEKDFPRAKVFRLEQNYRSTQTILKAATSVVEKNVGRKGKTLWTQLEEGERIQSLEVKDEVEEAQKVVEKIHEEIFQGKRVFHEFAILYRTNAQSRALEDGLRRAGISYVIVGGVRFYERKEIKDILAYLKIIGNPRDSVNLKRIINFPLRGIGDTTLGRIEKWALEKSIPLFAAISRVEEIPDLPQRSRESVGRFYQTIQKYMDLKGKILLTEWVHTLVEEIGFLRMYKEDMTIEGIGRAENVLELLNAIDEYVSTADLPTLSGFLEQVSLVTDVDMWDDKSNAVTLMTLHCAKGLEFPVVFITGMEEGLFPISRSIDNADALEEERRLFYVGLTRAKKKVVLTWAQTRRRFNDLNIQRPSRFLDEIDPTVVEVIRPMPRWTRDPSPKSKNLFLKSNEAHPSYESYSQEEMRCQPGMWVEHDIYGRGQITNVEGTGKKLKVTVQFEAGMKKKFIAQYAGFTFV